ncbi:hypothetical protein ABZ897_08890 [Nonomuraea sp. NPDC046802]|uniref:hypothetical protein n=1 Tax=Nonomuraea sp. NPDC046802 TaxID=3154919 RepID=UPI0033F12D01
MRVLGLSRPLRRGHEVEQVFGASCVNHQGAVGEPAGKLEEACGTLHEAIDLIEETRGGGGLNIAFTAGRELSPWRHEPWVQEINDRLFALMTT